jgi:hypothetical protein
MADGGLGQPGVPVQQDPDTGWQPIRHRDLTRTHQGDLFPTYLARRLGRIGRVQIITDGEENAGNITRLHLRVCLQYGVQQLPGRAQIASGVFASATVAPRTPRTDIITISSIFTK